MTSVHPSISFFQPLASQSFLSWPEEGNIFVIFSTYDEVYTSDVKSFLTQECNQVVDRLENRKLAAAKPLNLKVLLNCNTDTT